MVDAVRGDEQALTRLPAPQIGRELQISPKWRGEIDPDDVM